MRAAYSVAVSRLLTLIAAVTLSGAFIAGCATLQPTCEAVIAGIAPGAPIPEVGDTLPQGATLLVDAAEFDWASSSIGQSQTGAPALNLELRPEAARRFAAYTRANIGHFLSIALNGRIAMVPMIQAPIEGGSVTIEGGDQDGLDVSAFRSCVGG
jgi:preprotein translocase subunit SecD